MSYADDFAGADPAASPLDPTIMIGADPFFWGAVGLALLAAVLIGWLIGARSRARETDAAAAIWAAIDEAVRAAMQADTDALPAHAAELQRTLRARLGKTLAFGGEVNKRARALDTALKGEAADKPHHPPAAPAPAHDAAHGPGGHGAGESGHAAAPSAAASVTIVSVHAPPVASHPHPPSHPPEPDKRPLSTKERNDALRLAVADFNDHWRHRSAREGEMRAVVAELCDPGPRRPAGGHGGGPH